MPIDSYVPEKVAVILGGNIITGYADGTFVKVERNAETWTTVTGADGEVTRVKSADKSGKIVVTIKQSSDSNDILSDLFLADESSLQGYLPVLVKDANGRSLHAAQNAWIGKPADAEYGKDLTNREWTLHCDQIITFVGGNN
jgi:hypothetical protein